MIQSYLFYPYSEEIIKYHTYFFVAGNSMYRTFRATRKIKNINTYLRSDIGAFPIRRHFHNWRTEPTQHPILFIRAETIWNHLDVLQSFLDLPAEAMASFPKKKERSSSCDDLSPRERERLNQLYGDFSEEIRQMPDTDIRPADWFP